MIYINVGEIVMAYKEGLITKAEASLAVRRLIERGKGRSKA